MDKDKFFSDEPADLPCETRSYGVWESSSDRGEQRIVATDSKSDRRSDNNRGNNLAVTNIARTVKHLKKSQKSKPWFEIEIQSISDECGKALGYRPHGGGRTGGRHRLSATVPVQSHPTQASCGPHRATPVWYAETYLRENYEEWTFEGEVSF